MNVERGVACGQVFDEKCSTRSVGGDVRGGDVGSQAEVTEAEMEAMIDMIPGSYLRHLALLSCV